jgi:phosphopantetheinyl transferase
VAFPVGFEERMIFKPTATGERYHCRILPRSSAGKALRFDIWIYDLEGGLREMARGVVMKEISLGRTRPSSLFPDHVAVSLATIRDHCRAYAVIDVQTVAGFAAGALSIAEAKRFASMGPKRRQTFLMGRLALKLLSRKLSGENWETPASGIHTVMPDGLRPRCPVPDGHGPIFCSLSHDARFAVAVAGDGEVGVDVERISERILKVRRKFMDPEEMALTEASSLGVMEASIRAWSIKEGVVKATGRHLAESWRAAMIADIGYDRSRLTVLGIRYESFHDIVGDHIFTLVKRVD